MWGDQTSLNPSYVRVLCGLYLISKERKSRILSWSTLRVSRYKQRHRTRFDIRSFLRTTDLCSLDYPYGRAKSLRWGTSCNLMFLSSFEHTLSAWNIKKDTRACVSRFAISFLGTRIGPELSSAGFVRSSRNVKKTMKGKGTRIINKRWKRVLKRTKR